MSEKIRIKGNPGKQIVPLLEVILGITFTKRESGQYLGVSYGGTKYAICVDVEDEECCCDLLWDEDASHPLYENETAMVGERKKFSSWLKRVLEKEGFVVDW